MTDDRPWHAAIRFARNRHERRITCGPTGTDPGSAGGRVSPRAQARRSAARQHCETAPIDPPSVAMESTARPVQSFNSSVDCRQAVGAVSNKRAVAGGVSSPLQ
jgi:hypothetical protein